MNNDFTVAHDSKFYQIDEKIDGAKVIVEERLDGTMVITHQGVAVKYTRLPQRPQKQKKLHIPKTKARRRPPVDHPWRKLKNKPWTPGKWKAAKTG